MATKTPSKKKTPARKAAADTSLRVYRRIAVSFVVVVALLLALVIYVSTVRATIYVHPVTETLRTEFIVDVVEAPTRDSEVKGAVVSGSLGRSETFTPSGEGLVPVEGTARGTFTIHNETNLDQPLVATTRIFFEPTGMLYRIDESVVVPAGGRVDVAAHADQPGMDGDIEHRHPERFTIPGLNAAKQEVIYATLGTEFSGGVSYITALSQEEVDAAVSKLAADLEGDAKELLRTEAGGSFTGESFTTRVLETQVSEEVGEQVDSFEVTITVQTVGVFYDQESLEGVAQRQLYDQLDRGEELLSVNKESMFAKVEKVDEEGNRANIRVVLTGVSAASRTSSSLDPIRFAGMNEEEVGATLIADGIAEDVEVEFFPFWVKKVPKLADHVYIEIL